MAISPVSFSPSVELKPRGSDSTDFSQRIIDWLFGYDYFLAHRSIDGKAYASVIFDQLTDKSNGLDCFLDVKYYGAGHNLTLMQTRALKKTTRLIVIVTPEAHNPEAIYLLGEIREFLEKHPKGVIVPIGTAETLSLDYYAESKLLPIIPRYPNDICIMETDDGFRTATPSTHVLAKLLTDFTEERRTTKRLRWIQRTAALLLILLLSTIWFWRDSTQQTKEAVKQKVIAKKQESEAKKQESIARQEKQNAEISAQEAGVQKDNAVKQQGIAKKNENKAKKRDSDSLYTQALQMFDTGRRIEGLALLGASSRTFPDNVIAGDNLLYQMANSGTFVPLMPVSKLPAMNPISIYKNTFPDSPRKYSVIDLNVGENFPSDTSTDQQGIDDEISLQNGVKVWMGREGAAPEDLEAPQEYRPLSIKLNGKLRTLVFFDDAISSGIPIVSQDQKRIAVLHRAHEDTSDISVSIFDANSLISLVQCDVSTSWKNTYDRWLVGMSWSKKWLLLRWRRASEPYERMEILDTTSGNRAEWPLPVGSFFLPNLCAVIDLPDGRPGFVCQRGNKQWISVFQPCYEEKVKADEGLLRSLTDFSIQHPSTKKGASDKHYGPTLLEASHSGISAICNSYGQIVIKSPNEVLGTGVIPLTPKSGNGTYLGEVALSPDGERVFFNSESDDTPFWSLLDQTGRFVIRSDAGPHPSWGYRRFMENSGFDLTNNLSLVGFFGKHGEFLAVADKTKGPFPFRIRYFFEPVPDWVGDLIPAFYGVSIDALGRSGELPFREQLALLRKLEALSKTESNKHPSLDILRHYLISSSSNF